MKLNTSIMNFTKGRDTHSYYIMGELIDIKRAGEELRNGKIILYPTDTVWGIGCDINNEEAVQRIFEIKNRPNKKSFILLVDSVAMLERYIGQIENVTYDLIDIAVKPLTIIYDNPINIPAYLLAEDGSIGIRVTKDLNCKKMIQAIRRPIVSTSANISEHPTPKKFSEIHLKIKNNVDFILNDRLNEKMTTPSSIIKIGKGGTVKVIR